MIALLLLSCHLDLTPGDSCAAGRWWTLSDGSEVCGTEGMACLAECDLGWQACLDDTGAADAECVARSLETVAGVLEALPADAAVIITSDHGELLGEHGIHGHGPGWPVEATRVPLWVLGPGVEPEVIDTPTPPVAVAAMVRALLAGGRS